MNVRFAFFNKFGFKIKHLKINNIKKVVVIAILFFANFTLRANGDYLVIVSETGHRTEVFISKSGGYFEKMRLKNKSSYDWSGTLDIVTEYEEKGYELLSTNTTGARITFVMKKDDNE